MVFRTFCLWSFFVFSVPAYSANLAGSGERLAIWQKIQGDWRTGCAPQKGGNVFEEITLSVTYTELKFKSTKYKSSFCNQVVDVRQDAYKYVISGQAGSLSGKEAYAIDVQPLKAISGFRLHPLNIVYFEDGHLYFGGNSAGAANERANVLNLSQPFSR